MRNINRSYRQQKRAEIKALPIRFKAEAPGMYLSEAGPCSKVGEYRIHKTEHSGRGTSHSGRVHWHVKHVPTNQVIAHHFSSPYSLSLDDAIQTLHVVIGRWLRDGFEVLAKMNTDHQRKFESEQLAVQARAVLESKIARGMRDAGAADNLSLVRAIADSIEAP